MSSGSSPSRPAPAVPLTFHLVPHTHWDREWYLSRAGFLSRLVPALDDLLELLERDAGIRFLLDGQTIILEDYFAVRPDARDRVAAAVRRGALEIGPWYVLADELVPSGESLLRNLLEGARDAAALGRGMQVLYSPDAFGHPAALPRLAAEFGIRRGVAWRGVGRPGGRDRDLYRWESGTGAALLLHHLPRDGYCLGGELLERPEELAGAWAAIQEQVTPRASGGHIAVLVGADHHAPSPELARLAGRLRDLTPGHRVRLSGLEEFFDAVEPGAAAPAIRGELRRIDGHTWVLQGVHGTRARAKRRHGSVELGLSRIAEPLAALAAWGGGRDRSALLRQAWRTLLQSQFHDTICGTTADAAAREQEVRLETAETLAREIATRSLWELAGHDPDAARDRPDAASPRLLLWNPAPRTRSGVLTAELSFFRRDLLVGPPSGREPGLGPGFRPFLLRDATGRETPVQVLAVRRATERLDADRHFPDQDEVDRVFVAFHAPPVRGLGLGWLAPVPGTAEPVRSRHGVMVHEDTLISEQLAVRALASGEWTIEDRASGESYHRLGTLEDEPDAGDAYTFSRGVGRSVRPAGAVARRARAPGPLVGALELGGSLASAGRGAIDFRIAAELRAGSPIVRLRIDIDNRAADHRLRLRFPVGAGELAVAGAAFGVERRPASEARRARNAIEQPSATAPAHRFVAAAGGHRGLAILAPGFFEYEWTASRELVVTLLRSVGELSRGDLPERPGHAAWPTAIPLAQEPGLHTVQLALCPVSESDLADPGRLEALWEDAFLPVQAAFVRNFSGGTPMPGAGEGIGLEGEGLVLSAVKPSEPAGGLVLRCWNAGSLPAKGLWRLPRELRSAATVRADETPVQGAPLLADRRSAAFDAEPGGLATVRVE